MKAEAERDGELARLAGRGLRAAEEPLGRGPERRDEREDAPSLGRRERAHGGEQRALFVGAELLREVKDLPGRRARRREQRAHERGLARAVRPFEVHAILAPEGELQGAEQRRVAGVDLR